MTEPYGYMIVQREKGKRTNSFAYGKEEYVRAVAGRWVNKEPEPSDKNDEVEEPEFSYQTALADALTKAIEFGLSGFQLILVSGTAPRFFYRAMAEEGVIKPITGMGERLEETDDYELYSLNENAFDELVERQGQLDQMLAGVESLPSATLLSIVATFDTLIVDALGALFRLDDKYFEKSTKEISIREALASESLEELKERIISGELYEFSRGSHDEQERYIASNLHVSIKERWPRWSNYIEIFERRNLVAHGERTYNRRYSEICKKHGLKDADKSVGQEIALDSRYLANALDILTEFAVLLSFSLWRKRSTEDEKQAFSNLNDAVYKLILNNRYVLADRIASYALSLTKTSVEEETRRMLVVNRASAMRHAGDVEGAKRLLDAEDWTASTDTFKICVASVRDDKDAFVKLLPIVKAAGSVQAWHVRRWPCFSFVRDDQTVIEAFAATYGEPLMSGKAIEAAAANGVGEVAVTTDDCVVETRN